MLLRPKAWWYEQDTRGAAHGEVFFVSQEDAYQAITEAQAFVSAVSEYLASASR